MSQSPYNLVQASITVWSTCFFTEHLIQLPTEIRQIWFKQWNLITFLYLGARYATELNVAIRMGLMYGNITQEICSKIHIAAPITSVLGMLCAQLILCLRVWCLYGRQYWLLLAILLPAWTVAAVLQLIGTAHQMPVDGLARTVYMPVGGGAGGGERPHLQPGETMTFDILYCSSAASGRYVYFIPLASMILDFLLLLMVVGTAVWWRRMTESKVALGHASMRRLVFYFTIAFIPSLLRAIFMNSQNQGLEDLFSTASVVLTAIAATRIIQDLKNDMDLHANQSRRIRAHSASIAHGNKRQLVHFSSSEKVDANLSMMNPFFRNQGGQGMLSEDIYKGIDRKEPPNLHQRQQHTGRATPAMILRDSVILSAKGLEMPGAASLPPLPTLPLSTAATMTNVHANSETTLRAATASESSIDEEDKGRGRDGGGGGGGGGGGEDEFSRYIQELPEDCEPREPQWRRGHAPLSNNIDWTEAHMSAEADHDGGRHV